MSKGLTPLDVKLQEIACANWVDFVALIGEDAINAAKVCILRQQKNSYGQIAVKLGITEKAARYHCGGCDINA